MQPTHNPKQQYNNPNWRELWFSWGFILQFNTDYNCSPNAPRKLENTRDMPGNTRFWLQLLPTVAEMIWVTEWTYFKFIGIFWTRNYLEIRRSKQYVLHKPIHHHPEPVQHVPKHINVSGVEQTVDYIKNKIAISFSCSDNCSHAS